ALRRRREREVPALDPLDISVELPLETAPDAVRLHHERHLERIPPLLSHEAPVAARLLTGDLAALEQRHPRASPREVVRRRAAGDSAPDDYNVRAAFHWTHVSPSARVGCARMSVQAASTRGRRSGLWATVSCDSRAAVTLAKAAPRCQPTSSRRRLPV